MEVKNKLQLSENFINKYKNLSNPMTDLGNFVYYRTYSRFIESEQRREYWWETVKRVVEYNCNLVDGVSIEEAEKLFDNIFNLRQFPSGRSLWVGGTESSKKSPMSQFNCSFTTINQIEDFVEVFYLMLLGVGVGIRVLPEDIKDLPKINKNIKINHIPYNELENKATITMCVDGKYNEKSILVGDSKEGWVEAFKILLNTLTDSSITEEYIININYNNIRKKGEPLKTFGGTASGHESLKNMFDKIYSFCSKAKDNILSSLDCLDIVTTTGEAVLTGGVRRSASLVLFDVEDTDIRYAKNMLNQPNMENYYHRFNSNNSIFFKEKPDKSELEEIFNSIKLSYEPAFINSESAKKRFDAFEGLNPCCEILLPNKGLCNLTTLNMCAFLEDNELNLEKLEQALRLSVRVSYRMACVDLELPNWDKVQKENMLLGCSFTGWQDLMNILKYTEKEQAKLASFMREILTEEADSYADSLGRNIPKLITTIKPEGTLSLLPTVSAGLHFSHSPYYIRRVRVNHLDPIVKVCEELEWDIHIDPNNKSNRVIDFPCKAPKGKTIDSVSAIEQLEIYRMFMDSYVDHNASNTISVRENEWKNVADWVYSNWDSFVGISFINLDTNFYELAPYEKITEKQYNKMIKNRKSFDPELLNKYIKQESKDEDLEDGCSSGACPIR